MSSNLIPYSWPGWETVGILGKGGFGAVYEIRRQIFDSTEQAAMKVISIPQSEGEITELYNDGYTKESIATVYKSHLKRIVDEYSVMRMLNGYPNIVSCDDVRYEPHEDGIGWDIYIKMELLTPLAKALPQQIPEAMVIKIATDLCKALEACQEHKLLHRDIKPQNIFVAPDGTYKLGDFGIAKTIEKTTGGTKIGTYRYMAPEIYNNKPYGMSSDVYSLGLVLYWLLNERRMPFLPLPPAVPLHTEEERAKDRRFAGEPLPPPAHGRQALKDIVLKACAFDQANRYHTAAQLRADLEALPKAAIVLPPQPDPEKESQTCLHCGQPLLPNANFCKYCGKATTLHSTPVPAKSAEATPAKSITNFPAEESTSTTQPVAIPQPISAPQPKDTAKQVTQEKQKKSSLKWILRIVAMVLVLALAFLLLRNCQAKPTPTESSSPTVSGQVDAFPAPTESSSPTVSDWVDELPAHVTDDQHQVETRTLYASQTLLDSTTSTTESQMDGWELHSVSEANSYKSTGEWTSTPLTESADRRVETRTVYEYRDKEFTESSSSSKSGWTLYNTTYANHTGSPSDWSTTKPAAQPNRTIYTKTQYRYFSKEFTTSQNSSLGGWHHYDTTYSNWSGNNTTSSKPTESDTLQITSTKQTKWGYYHYCNNYGNDWHIDSIPYGSGNKYHSCTSSSAYKKFSMADQGGQQPYGGQGTGASKCVYGFYVWFRNPSADQYTYTYQTRSATYHFWKWTATPTVDWQDQYIEENGNILVETRTLYQYIDTDSVPTYYYYRYPDNWRFSETPVTKTENRQVREVTQYCYAEKQTETTYYFRKWSPLSEWTEEEIIPSDTIRVETKVQYRYKRK